MRMFLKNDEGKPSVSLTMVVVSFTLVTLWFAGWVFLSSFGFNVPPFDAVMAMSYLTPQLGLYFSRRFTSKQDATGKTIEISMNESVEEPESSK